MYGGVRGAVSKGAALSRLSAEVLCYSVRSGRSKAMAKSAIQSVDVAVLEKLAPFNGETELGSTMLQKSGQHYNILVVDLDDEMSVRQTNFTLDSQGLLRSSGWAYATEKGIPTPQVPGLCDGLPFDLHEVIKAIQAAVR